MKHAGFSIVRATLVAMTMTALGDVDCRVDGDAHAFGESSQGSTAEVTASSS